MIGIIDYGAGNTRSLKNALEKLGQRYCMVRTPKELGCAHKVIFPGDGAAGAAMQSLLESDLVEAIPRLKIPFLGICIGLQLLAEFSDENSVECLSVIPGKVRRFDTTLKVPHMGWNRVRFTGKFPLARGIKNGSYFYFVHSYYFDAPQEIVYGETVYGRNFPSCIAYKNFYAVQFHPEKSGGAGLKLLSNFCAL